MAEEPQQKKSKVQSDGYKDRFLAVFPELVDTVTKDGLGSSEIGVAMQHFKSVSIHTAYCFSIASRITAVTIPVPGVYCSWRQAEQRTDGDRFAETFTDKHGCQTGEGRTGFGLVC